MPRNSNISLSIIIPAYNEAARIGKTLQSVNSYLRGYPHSYEVIVVDDGSKDDTSNAVLKFADKIKNLKLLRFNRNQGKGWAVREGMLNAQGRYRLFMDADGSTAIEHWNETKKALDNGADIAIGSRHVLGSVIEVQQAPHRVFLGYTFRQLVKMILGMRINDTQNGFKAFRAEAAARIFGKQLVSGWAFDVEILSIGKDLKYEMVEVPITWIDDNRSRMRFSAMPTMLIDILRVRLRRVQPRPVYRIREAPVLQRLA